MSTIDLARLVDPCLVVGIDIANEQVCSARERAEHYDVGNVLFETGSVYDLPFDSDSFDLVFCNGLLFQLSDPCLALQEMHRVTAPGSQLCAREPDYASATFYPLDNNLHHAFSLQMRACKELGLDMNLGRRLREVFADVGFGYTEASASCDSFGTPESIEHLAAGLLEDWQEAPWSRHVRRQGWIDEVTVQSFLQSIRDFAEDPYAVLAIPCFEVCATASESV
jgi:ubiquinone/menaquinone biosynthesis C-methylase UbiE